MNPVVVITTVQPALIFWIATIALFMGIALAAIVSPGRRWFELTVILALAMLIFGAAGFAFTQLVLGYEVVVVDAIASMRG
ncbi:hypothetical protein FRC96_10165 [Lujinxingia vulgaris]|uniref:NADH-quinone oxidoreductase subunit N n=1 Tax=Lujinxingia vulgaris TaxID=2600176 RepID=A0A5C6X3X9_9DELT|nr:hypothetical protein [Lujinxingia vulgaris]TXD36434.1 hypothetical protein FRC96_10165 [Lujinxingia vulgaris]